MRQKLARAIRKKIRPPGRGREVKFQSSNGQAQCSLEHRLYQFAKRNHRREKP